MLLKTQECIPCSSLLMHHMLLLLLMPLLLIGLVPPHPHASCSTSCSTHAPHCTPAPHHALHAPKHTFLLVHILLMPLNPQGPPHAYAWLLTMSLIHLMSHAPHHPHPHTPHGVGTRLTFKIFSMVYPSHSSVKVSSQPTKVGWLEQERCKGAVWS